MLLTKTKPERQQKLVLRQITQIGMTKTKLRKLKNSQGQIKILQTQSLAIKTSVPIQKGWGELIKI